MSIFILGLNHKSAPLSIREKVAFAQHAVPHALISLNCCPAVEENVILSTCNRVEIYTASSDPDCIARVKEFIIDYHELREDIFTHCYCYQDFEAVRHLFTVVASLDSMVIGENQILGQVKDAYFKARSCEVVGATLSLLFEEAIKLGKKVRTATTIGEGAVSISTAAIELAKKVVKSFAGKTVLIVGAGTIGELMVRNLGQRGVSSICVANRTYSAAMKLAEDFGGKAVHFDELRTMLSSADIVICSTSAPHYLITHEDIVSILPQRSKPLFLIDLGVPRNIEKTIADIDDIYLYNIDDLEAVCEKNLSRRWSEVKRAEEIIDGAIDYFSGKINLVECRNKK